MVVALLVFLNWYIAPDKPGERKDLVLGLAQILGGAALLAGLYFTWRTLQVNREGQITDRFTRAIDQLGATGDEGNKRLEIRLGGIYALGRIARDSPERDYSTVMEVLTANIRENVHKSAEQNVSATPQKAVLKLPADIQAILDVIGHREEDRVPNDYGKLLDLRGVNLQGAKLRGAYLGGIDLRGAKLKGATTWLKEADLRGADLRGADLGGANLMRANLQGTTLWGAHLERASLEGASLEGAHLEGAKLRGADLRGTIGLTQKQLDMTVGDELTRLPDYLEAPASWSVKSDRQPEGETSPRNKA